MELLTTAAVAKRLGVARATVTSWCRRGRFPNVVAGPRTGRGPTYLIPESDLVDFTPPALGRPAHAVPSPAATAKRRSRARAAETLPLSPADAAVFIEARRDPPAPRERQRAAARRNLTDVERRHFLDQHNADMAALRADPEAWAAYQAELAAWDVTLLDGLEDEPPAS